jgi:hypothetical protein
MAWSGDHAITGLSLAEKLPPDRIRAEVSMIELTQEQRHELAGAEPEVIDPESREVYVLVRKNVYERLKRLAYDDSPWTEEEMDLLAEEAGDLLDRYQP